MKRLLTASALAMLPAAFCVATPATANNLTTVNHAAKAHKTAAPALATLQNSFTPKPNLHPRFRINGFASAGFTTTNSAVPYNIPGHGAVNNELNFTANSLVGLQLTADLGGKMTAVTQIVASGDNLNGKTAFSPEVQWAFLRYRMNSNLQFRAGRFQTPFFMYSSTIEVGYTYPWVSLPNEVYRIVPFTSFNGVDLIYRHSLGESGWSMMLHPFFGQNRSQYSLAPGLLANFDEQKIMGATAAISDAYVTLRATYAQTSLSGDATAPTSQGTAKLDINDQNTSFYGFGLKAKYKKLRFTSEYAHRNTPDSLASLSGFYAMLGYKHGNWLPNFTYGSLTTNNIAALDKAHLTGLAESAEDQLSYALGLDYTFNPNVVVKGSVSMIKPTHGSSGLFDSKPSKNTVMLYGVSVDAIF